MEEGQQAKLTVGKPLGQAYEKVGMRAAELWAKGKITQKISVRTKFLFFMVTLCGQHNPFGDLLGGRSSSVVLIKESVTAQWLATQKIVTDLGYSVGYGRSGAQLFPSTERSADKLSGQPSQS